LDNPNTGGNRTGNIQSLPAQTGQIQALYCWLTKFETFNPDIPKIYNRQFQKEKLEKSILRNSAGEQLK
jgi:hypothetical protein